MPTVTFITPDGEELSVGMAPGETLMHAATKGNIQGIVAECGGAMSCATCHVLVEEKFLKQLSTPSDTEDQMLDFTAAPRAPSSRLACQIVMTEELDGLIVRIADPQL